MDRRFWIPAGALVATTTALGLAFVVTIGERAVTAAPHAHGASAHPKPGKETQKQIRSLRGATARFWAIDIARREGYAPFGGCFAEPGLGGMGHHYANDTLIADPEIDPLRPELVLYDMQPDGSARLIAVEYITFKAAWHAAGHSDPPSLFGQTFHVNETLLPEPFYLLHVWNWEDNPRGVFADWNPRISCR